MLLKLLQCSVLISLAHSWSCSDSEANTTLLSLTTLKQVDSLAVCNDGTPAAFYFKPGRDPSLWLVYLAGGDWCYDEASCATRAALPHVGNGGFNGTQHTSSLLFPSHCPKEGIFSEEAGAALREANKVYIPYCSSDAWMGDRAGSPASNGWHFRGRRVVQATIKAIQDKHWKDVKQPVRLVFGGGSAGGRGAMTLLDMVSEALPEHVSVRGFLDSNMWLDISSLNQTFMGFGAQTQAAFKYVDATGVVSPDCALMYKGEEWKCVFGQYRMPFVKSPYLITASQYDSWQLRFDVCDDSLGCAIPDRAMAYTDNYGMLVQQYLAGTPPVRQRNNSAVYSQACYNHHMSESDLFSSSVNGNGISENEALRSWLQDEGRSKEWGKWVDLCQGYQCSGCA